MATPDPQLVQLITQQVIAVLRERGIVPGAGAAAQARVEIRPPMGVCTGDYSQFPELAGRNVGAEKQDAKPQAAAVLPLTGIITANQLQAAMDASSGGAVVLAVDARLSPLANDLARKFPNRIQRASASSNKSENPADAADLPWLWWIDGSCPVVSQVTTERSARLRASSAPHSPASLSGVVRELASAIKARRVAGGILFVHNAARAMCLANRCASIRAVVGTCGEAVEQGVTELGANVLVVEYPHHGYRGVSQMVDRMLQQPPKPPASIERELADLHRCG
ncbi:MAG: hypothetical protein K8S99_07790 [Planctomycetes bacterium]|nr:hypothetical protein [Planctomycetota bacterium]